MIYKAEIEVSELELNTINDCENYFIRSIAHKLIDELPISTVKSIINLKEINPFKHQFDKHFDNESQKRLSTVDDGFKGKRFSASINSDIYK